MKTILTIITLLTLVSCNNTTEYPHAIVIEGREIMVVYKAEKVEDKEEAIKYGTYKYAVTDNTKYGWTFVSFQKFNVGDTIKISK